MYLTQRNKDYNRINANMESNKHCFLFFVEKYMNGQAVRNLLVKDA